MTLKGYILFITICICYGTNYAVTALFVNKMNDAAFTLLRLFAAAIAAVLYYLLKLFDKNYRIEAYRSLSSGDTNFWKSFFCGILFLGLPTTLTIIAQKEVPSFVVTVAQPTIPFFSMIAAHIFTKDEKITFNNFVIQLIALAGAIFTLIPTLDFEATGDSSFFSYVLLLISIVMYGIGAVYIKVYLDTADITLSCLFTTIGAFVYSLISGVWRFGYFYLFNSMFDSSMSDIWISCIIGIVYNMIPTFLFMDCIREIGVIKTQLTNFGQIIIGVFCGAIFLNEWKDFTGKEIFLIVIGLILIIAAMVGDFCGQVSGKISNKYVVMEYVTYTVCFIAICISYFV